MPLRDPATAVMADPQVPESQRFCAHLRRAGRARPRRASRAGPRASARGTARRSRSCPGSTPGDLVDDRYEILGALAHGGLGWIYLARDRNISESGSDRWVVLKGLINTGDADAMAAAVAERRFLVEVDHPNIVKIHDFAQHPDPKTGEKVGYIVMEYVGGRSLRDLALDHTGPGRSAATPLPLAQVLAYGIEILPALGYLHERGLLFCDFKPDNVIHAEEQLKLIDLGAVRRIDDQASPLCGTPGYQAPELATRARRSAPTSTPSAGRSPCSASTSAASPPGTRPACPTRPTCALLAQRGVVLPAAAAGHPHRPGAAVRLGRRDGRPADRRAARGAVDGRRRAPARGLDAVHPGAARVRGDRGRRRRPPAGTALDGPAVAAALPLPLVDPTDPAAGFLATLERATRPSVIAALRRRRPNAASRSSLRLVRAQARGRRPGRPPRTTLQGRGQRRSATGGSTGTPG